MGSTAARYLIQQMLPRPYTLECTMQVLVSDIKYSALLFFVSECTQISVYKEQTIAVLHLEQTLVIFHL